jgi:hypothetical protein
MDDMQTQSPEGGQQGRLAGRVVSIDALRGFDMFWIIGGGAIFASLYDIFANPATVWIHTRLNHVKW